ncbi:MGMT family protein [Candidatus Falkowbacteria bacterium]|nr:MGMT family protein [Candidatus Falkowbacteria bacterium]
MRDNNPKELTYFEKKVLAEIKKIPRGKVTTYRLLARAIERPKAARAVGNALRINPYALKVPCHRVVKSDGTAGGYAGGEIKKFLLLKKEGIEFNSSGRIENIKKFLHEF